MARAVNVRSGPGTNFPIVAKVNPGTVFTVVSKSQDDTWWQICCISAATSVITGTATTTGTVATTVTAWMASSVVKVAGAGDAVAVSERLFNPDAKAQWQVHWKCASDRCQVKQCSAVVDAKAGRVTTTNPGLTSNTRSLGMILVLRQIRGYLKSIKDWQRTHWQLCRQFSL